VGAFAAMAATTASTCPRPLLGARWTLGGVPTSGPCGTGRRGVGYMRAMRNPNQEFAAGRVFYLFDGVHLWYALPSGRVLCYPYVRFEPDGVSYANALGTRPGRTECPSASLERLGGREHLPSGGQRSAAALAAQVDDVVLTVHDEILFGSVP